MISFQNDILPLKNQLYRLALRITLDSAEAEDIVQETLIKVWDRRESWIDIDNIEAFCFTICRNKALDYVRSVSSRNESLDVAQNERPDTSYTPSQRTVVSDQMAMVRHIVDSLPEKQKSCIQLRDFEDVIQGDSEAARHDRGAGENKHLPGKEDHKGKVCKD